MATSPYVGEIRALAFNFAPAGWALCNGQLMSISQNTALFSVIGTFYGGDGQTTFGLPNLQGCVPVGSGSASSGNYNVGQIGGTSSVTLTGQQIPIHNHPALGSTGLSSAAPGSGVLPGTFASSPAYTTDTSALSAMSGSFVVPLTGGQPHENRQPSLVVNICISLQGIFPSRS